MNKKPSYQDFVKSLTACKKNWKTDKTNQLNVAWGLSDYLISKTAETFKQTIISNKEAEYTSYEASELNEKMFFELCESQGMFDPDSVYVIRRAQRQKSLAKWLSSLKQSSSINNYILICYEGKSLPAKLKKEIERLEANKISCFQPTDRNLPSFIQGLGQKHQLKLGMNAAYFIHSHLGDNLFRIENEIFKLSLIFSDCSDEIKSQDIAPHLGMLKEDHIFKLTNLLIDRRFASAQSLVSDLLKRGESGVAILGILARHARNLLLIGGELERGQSTVGLTKKLRIPQFIIKNYIVSIKNTNLKSASKALSLCQDADIQLKTSSSVNEELILGEIIEAYT